MSGGHLEFVYYLAEWARELESVNPLLASMLRDLDKLMHTYDYYLAGDCLEERVAAAWKEYREKWLEIDTDHVEALLFEKCLDLVHSAVSGVREI